MARADGTFCKICLKDLTDKKFRVTLKVTSILPLNVNLDEKDYMCNDCSVKLYAAYDFKMMCLDTEDSVISYVESKKALKVDLIDVYVKVKDGGEHVALDQQVCRLCMCIVRDGFTSLEEFYDANMVGKYIPEVNFSITKDPVVCKQCSNSLRMHIDFLRMRMEIKEEIKIEAQDPDKYLCIKSEEIHLKFEECTEDEDASLRKVKEEILKNENSTTTNTHISHSSSSSGTQEDFPVHNLNESYEGNSKLEQLMCTDPLELNMYKCDKCTFRTKWRHSFVGHQIVHRDSSEVQVYKCGKCSFRTIYNRCLKAHQLRHKNSSEVQTYKCDECDYRTKRKNDLTRHQLQHRNPSEVKIYRCDKCPYQSTWKSNVVQHQLLHRNTSEMQTYRCDKCPFQTRWKVSFKRHQLGHRGLLKERTYVSEAGVYKCNNCAYETKLKYSLVRHQLRHKDVSQVEKMYRCDECDYRAKRKNNLIAHQLRHKDNSEVRMYKCDKCDYQTKRKSNLAPHQLRHKGP